jgi:hypothetical protein
LCDIITMSLTFYVLCTTGSVQLVLRQSPGLPARGSLQPETPCVTFAGPMWLHPKGDDERRAVAETK